MKFSQRMGISPASKVVQIEGMDDDLKNGLWNVIEAHILRPADEGGANNVRRAEALTHWLWVNYFKLRLDQMPTAVGQRIRNLRTAYFQPTTWWKRLDLVEESVHWWSGFEDLGEPCNEVFKRENAGWRFIDLAITPVAEKTDVEAVEDALAATQGIGGAREHLKTSIELLSSRDQPDYRNSIKESISAVETVVKVITKEPKATLGQALDLIPNLHGALRKSLESLYGYTSDADGIRHGMMDTADLTVIDARFALVTCSAFCSYLVAKAKPVAADV
jgi:hypothetical protein